MFKNLTKRERVLAMIVASLAPIAIVFMIVLWFISAYASRDMQTVRLRKQLNAATDLFDESLAAKERLRFYEATSFPPERSKSIQAFDVWINDVIQDKIGMEIVNRPKATTSPISVMNNGRKDIGNRMTRPLKIKGTLDQWVQFVDHFNRSALLKRITSFRMTPLTIGGTGPNKNVRSGKFNIDVTIDFVSLKQAQTSDPTSSEIATSRSLKDYQQIISQRNIFAPANNAPTLSASLPSKQYSGEEVSFRLKGEDPDEHDTLNFEMISFTGEKGSLDGSLENGKNGSATFSCAPLDVGEYKIVAEVTDSGNPSKSDRKEFVLNVTKKPNSQPSIARSSRNYEGFVGESVQFPIEVEDDDGDEVSLELEECELVGAKLSKIEGKENQFDFYCDTLPEGRHEFSIKLDDGKEPKKNRRTGEPEPNIAKIKINIMPPKFLEAMATKIGGIIEQDGGDVVWIQVRSSGVVHKVKAGDTFELDRQTWTVKSVSGENDEVILEVDGSLRTYKFRDMLDSPRTTTTLNESDSESTESPVSTTVPEAVEAKIEETVPAAVEKN